MKHPQATTFEQRHEIQERTAQHERLVEIAQAMYLGYHTVRKWAHRPAAALRSHYGRAAHGALSTFAPVVRYVALRLKRENPQWGPNVILDALRQRPSLKRRWLRLPSRAALARYDQQWPRLVAKRRARYPQETVPSPLRPTRVHEQWQYDFKAARQVRGVGVIALADWRDPVSGVTCSRSTRRRSRRSKPTTLRASRPKTSICLNCMMPLRSCPPCRLKRVGLPNGGRACGADRHEGRDGDARADRRRRPGRD